MRKLLLLPILALAGCGLSQFTEPATNPVIEDRLGDVLFGEGELIGTLATKAERRIVLSPLQGKNIGKFCAEPSPDAAEALAATFAASAEGSLTASNSATKTLKAELQRSLATSVAALTRRSQGLQFFRDGVFALCQFQMNDFITQGEFTRQYFELRDASAALIRDEVTSANWNALPTVTISAPATPAAGGAGAGGGDGA